MDKDQINFFIEDLNSMVIDLERIISKQKRLIFDNVITEEKAKSRIENWNAYIQENEELINILQKQLNKD